jgi:hypothetical protein
MALTGHVLTIGQRKTRIRQIRLNQNAYVRVEIPKERHGMAAALSNALIASRRPIEAELRSQGSFRLAPHVANLTLSVNNCCSLYYYVRMASRASRNTRARVTYMFMSFVIFERIPHLHNGDNTIPARTPLTFTHFRLRELRRGVSS